MNIKRRFYFLNQAEKIALKFSSSTKNQNKSTDAYFRLLNLYFQRHISQLRAFSPHFCTTKTQTVSTHQERAKSFSKQKQQIPYLEKMLGNLPHFSLFLHLTNAKYTQICTFCTQIISSRTRYLSNLMRNLKFTFFFVP